MKQRVGIVRALATSPQVMLMDEPFGALDSQTRVVMQQILTNMWQRLRLSVLFITHDIEEAIFLTDRVYVMTARPGRIKAEIEIPLPRPRTAEMMSSVAFTQMLHKLRNLIREESLVAMGNELDSGGLEGFAVDVGRGRRRTHLTLKRPARTHGFLGCGFPGPTTMHHIYPSDITDHRRSGLLEIAWPDGSVGQLSHSLLRLQCRCAGCEQQRRTAPAHPPTRRCA